MSVSFSYPHSPIPLSTPEGVSIRPPPDEHVQYPLIVSSVSSERAYHTPLDDRLHQSKHKTELYRHKITSLAWNKRVDKHRLPLLKQQELVCAAKGANLGRISWREDELTAALEQCQMEGGEDSTTASAKHSSRRDHSGRRSKTPSPRKSISPLKLPHSRRQKLSPVTPTSSSQKSPQSKRSISRSADSVHHSTSPSGFTSLRVPNSSSRSTSPLNSGSRSPNRLTSLSVLSSISSSPISSSSSDNGLHNFSSPEYIKERLQSKLIERSPANSDLEEQKRQEAMLMAAKKKLQARRIEIDSVTASIQIAERDVLARKRFLKQTEDQLDLEMRHLRTQIAKQQRKGRNQKRLPVEKVNNIDTLPSPVETSTSVSPRKYYSCCVGRCSFKANQLSTVMDHIIRHHEHQTHPSEEEKIRIHATYYHQVYHSANPAL